MIAEVSSIDKGDWYILALVYMKSVFFCMCAKEDENNIYKMCLI